jgi:kinesin family member 5
VACSPHSSVIEETSSALKFATRAKTIKNYFKMNVKSSTESLAIMIEQLKIELNDCRK